MHNCLVKLLCTFHLLMASSLCFAYTWQLQYDEDGIKAYESETVDSPFHTVKIVSTTETTLDALVALHKDIDNFMTWGADLKSASVVSPGEKDYMLHFTYHAPWPVMDRDLVFRTLITQSSPQVVRLDFFTVDNVPLLADYQRVREAKGYWQFTARPDGKIDIEHLTYSDPGGSLPAFLVNTKSLEIPLKTYKAMLLELRKEPYKSAFVPYLVHPGDN